MKTIKTLVAIIGMVACLAISQTNAQVPTIGPDQTISVPPSTGGVVEVEAEAAFRFLTNCRLAWQISRPKCGKRWPKLVCMARLRIPSTPPPTINLSLAALFTCGWRGGY